MSRFVDTHIHSNISDGSLSVPEVVDITKKHTSVFSITDHDTIICPSLIKPLLNDADCAIAVPGIEISAYITDKTHGKILVDVLGYGFNQSHEFNGLLHRFKEHRNESNKLFMRQVLGKHKNLSHEHFSGINTVRYCRFAKYMSAILLSRTEKPEEFTDVLKYLEYNQPVYMDYHVKTRTAIDAIHSANGVAVLAHPTEYKAKYGLKKSELIRMIKYVASIGIDGIETYYSESSNEEMEWLLFVTQQHNLLYSGGSDFHHPEKNKIIGYGIDDNLCLKETSLATKMVQERLYFNKGGLR